MNIRAQAIADHKMTLEDEKQGFGWPVIIEDGVHTLGVTTPCYCQVGRKNFEIDAGTALFVEGNLGFVTVSIPALLDAGFDVEGATNNWLITTITASGTIENYNVKFKQLEHTLGFIILFGETINRANNSVNEALILGHYNDLKC